MGIALSGWLDRWDSTVLGDIKEAQFGFLNVGHGAWDKLPEIERECGSFVDGYGLRYTDKPIVNRFPSGTVFADWQADQADELVRQGVPKHKLYLIGLDEEHENDYATAYDTAHCDRAHFRGYKVSGGHYSYGWNFNARSREEQDRIIAYWRKCDIVARHAYRGFKFNADPPSFADDIDTIFASIEWRGWPKDKHLPCEGGADFWAAFKDDHYHGEGKPGFRAIPMDEMEFARMIAFYTENMRTTGKALGYGHFAVAAQNDNDWRNFYGSRAIYRYWRENIGKLRLPEAQPPQEDEMPITKEDLAQVERVLVKEALDVHVRLNEAKDNPGATFEAILSQMGRELDTAFSEGGQVVNKIREEFAELSKKL